MNYERCEVEVAGLPPLQTSYVGPNLQPQTKNVGERQLKQPIMLLHGFDSNALEFRNIYPYLSQETDTYAVDLIGCVLDGTSNTCKCWGCVSQCFEQALADPSMTFTKFCRSGFTDMSFYSDDEGLPLGPEQIRMQLYEFWKAKIGRPAVVLGTSLGGTVALDFASTYPEVCIPFYTGANKMRNCQDHDPKP